MTRPVWDLLHDAGAELVLSGHDHHYERFAAQNPDGRADPNDIVEIIGRVGGKDLYGPGETEQDNSVKRIWDKFGVLRLDFTATSVTSSFVGTVLDTSPAITCR